VSKLAG
jgi:hypothetical protein